ncbi:alpha/beta hydrolase [Pseudolabrys sp. Root1462]|jgi:lysophospholipase|uniref:alpha/beta fold hydrolase n=1 Tax=Pseudolabrys sp. Root1462 TaxID=1736466 RepID=UPI000702593C|nr:alpha/beta hydrolase [Pseudolabrys sp. Root1462]KQZ02162.1 alpha/beta hydrolase [Pseudolabrys sp. Root1462]
MKFVSIPANPVPENGLAGVVKTPDGVSLRFGRWEPPPGRKGTVVILQGRAEFIEKYFETVRDLRARGFAVATFDWRGQGLSDRALSDRRKGYVRNFSQYAMDLDTIMEQVVLPDCPPPYFVLGHSMGGAIAIRACHDGRRWFERVVLSAPMLALPPSRFSGMVGPVARFMRLMGRGSGYVPGSQHEPAGPEDFIGNVLTSDPVRFARNAAILVEEPDLALGAPTIAWADSALRQMRQFREPSYPAHIRQPLLLVAAGYDQVVWTPAIEDFGMYLLAGRHLILPGARHEILQEQDQFRAQFWAAFDAFVPGTPRY